LGGLVDYLSNGTKFRQTIRDNANGRERVVTNEFDGLMLNGEPAGVMTNGGRIETISKLRMICAVRFDDSTFAFKNNSLEGLEVAWGEAKLRGDPAHAVRVTHSDGREMLTIHSERIGTFTSELRRTEPPPTKQ
jgi:hypothetical protein